MSKPPIISEVKNISLDGSLNSAMMRSEDSLSGVACKFHDAFFINNQTIDGKIMPKSGIRVFIEAAFVFADDKEWHIGEITDINLFHLYVFKDGDAVETEVSKEVLYDILDKIRPLITFHRLYNGTKVITKAV